MDQPERICELDTALLKGGGEFAFQSWKLHEQHFGNTHVCSLISRTLKQQNVIKIIFHTVEFFSKKSELSLSPVRLD